MKPFNYDRRIPVISIILGILILFAAGYGLISSDKGEIESFKSIKGEEVELYGKGLYKLESKAFGLQGVAQDMISLFIGLPLLIAGLILYKRESLKGYLILTGTIGYFIYTYTSFSFMIHFNSFFLLYVTIMSLSILSIVLLLNSAESEVIKASFKESTPVMFFGILQIVLSSLFVIMWAARIIPTFSGDFSGLLLEHYTTAGIQVLDIGFEIPLGFIAGIQILRRKPVGYLLSSIMLFKLTTLFIAIVNMVLIQHLGGVEQSLSESIIFIGLGLLLLISFFMLLSNIKRRGLVEQGRSI